MKKVNYLFKNVLVLFAFISFFSNDAKAGAAVPWNLTGNTPDLGDFLGSTNPSPLQIRTANTLTPQPILFQTNGATERMRITPTGLVGMGVTAPASMLHINSNGNAIGGEVFHTTGPAGNTNAWRMFVGNGNGQEYFNIHNPAGTQRIFLENTRNGADATLGFITNTAIRMKIEDGVSGTASGRITMGNNIPSNFTPDDRLHLFHDAQSAIKIRFSNPTFPFGSNLGIQNNGDFRITQFEDNESNYFTHFC